MVRAFASTEFPVKTRRQDYAANTRQALLDSATRLFERDGYVPCSLESIVAEARVTKGALYHHFSSKQALFEAVVEDLFAELVSQVLTQALAQPDHRSQLSAGLSVFLDACLEPRHHRLVLEQGPVALGWQRWRDISERHLLSLLGQNLETLVVTEHLVPAQVDMLTRLLFAVICEAAMVIAAADDRDAARRDAGQLVERLLRGFGGTEQPPGQ